MPLWFLTVQRVCDLADLEYLFQTVLCENPYSKSARVCCSQEAATFATCSTAIASHWGFILNSLFLLRFAWVGYGTGRVPAYLYLPYVHMGLAGWCVRQRRQREPVVVYFMPKPKQVFDQLVQLRLDCCQPTDRSDPTDRHEQHELRQLLQSVLV